MRSPPPGGTCPPGTEKLEPGLFSGLGQLVHKELDWCVDKVAVAISKTADLIVLFFFFFGLIEQKSPCLLTSISPRDDLHLNDKVAHNQVKYT